MEKAEFPVETEEIDTDTDIRTITYSTHEVQEKTGTKIMTCAEDTGFHNGKIVEDGTDLGGEFGYVYQVSRTVTLPILDRERLSHLMIFSTSSTYVPTMSAEDNWPVAAQASEAVNTLHTNAQFWKIQQDGFENTDSAGRNSTIADQSGVYQFRLSNGHGRHLVNGIVKGSNITVNPEKKYYFCKQWLDNQESLEEHFGSSTAIYPSVVITFYYTDKPQRNCRFCKRELFCDTFDNLVGAMAFAHKKFKLLFEEGGINIAKDFPKLLAHQISTFEDMEAEITEKGSSDIIKTFSTANPEAIGSIPSYRGSLKTTDPASVVEGLI